MDTSLQIQGARAMFLVFYLNLEKEKENEGIKIISNFKRLLQGGFAIMAHTI